VVAGGWDVERRLDVRAAHLLLRFRRLEDRVHATAGTMPRQEELRLIGPERETRLRSVFQRRSTPGAQDEPSTRTVRDPLVCVQAMTAGTTSGSDSGRSGQADDTTNWTRYRLPFKHGATAHRA